jgi:hypothetical protein
MTLRSVTATAIAGAMLATSVTPAMAQSFPGGGYGNQGWGNRGWSNGWDRDRRHHDRGISAGEVVAGIAIIGVIAAIASAASKNNNRNVGNINNENDAANACASRAEQRYGNGARANVDDVYRTRDGYDVRGTLDAQRGWNDRNGYGERFTCSVRYGRVEDVRIGDDSAFNNGY